MENVDLVYFDAGGGHRSAALALRGIVASQRRPWKVRLVQLFDVLDPDGSFRRLTRMAPEDLYNRRLARGWTLGLGSELRLLQAMIRASHASLVGRLSAHWTRTRPDLVVSLVPNFNRALYESVRAARPGVPFVTVMTDLADLPPHFWIEPGQDQTIVCGSGRALEQALAAGYGADRIRVASGMIVRREFYEPAVEDRGAALRALGLDPSAPTGIVMFGGQGSATMLRIAEALADRQLILLCGHNAALVDRLRALRRPAPHAAVGFTAEVHRLMRLGDWFCGKPGPGALSEAVQCRLPVVTFRNAWTMPQERYNTRWVEERGIGRVVSSPRSLGPAVGELLAGLERYRERVDAIDNRALFEVPDFLAELLPPGQVAARPGRRLRPLPA